MYLLGPKCRRWTVDTPSADTESEWGAAPLLLLPAQTANNVEKFFDETRNLEMHMHSFRQRSEHYIDMYCLLHTDMAIGQLVYI